MRNARKVQPVKGAALGAVLCLVMFTLLGGGAAYAAAPAWKLISVTGPTNIPPQQSEIQRVTIEAEEGTFTLRQQTALGKGLFKGALGEAEITSGSNIANVKTLFGSPFTVGEQLASFTPFPPETRIVAISGSATEPVLELSAPATATEANAFLSSTSNVVTGVTTSSGQFHVGDELEVEFGVVPNGTTVTAVGPGTLTLSAYPSFAGLEPSIKAFEKTVPVAFNASATALQGAFEALPGFGPGAAFVSGGPGGSAASPYFIAFGGPLANVDVQELEVDGSSLMGAHPNAQVFTTLPGGPGTGTILITPTNIGGAQSSGLVTVRLGPLPGGIVTAGPAVDEEGKWTCPGSAGETTVTCELSDSVKALGPASSIQVPVEVDQTAASNSAALVTIEGGGAIPAAYQVPISVSSQEAPFGVQAMWAGAFDPNGVPVTQAGAHPFSAQTFFRLTTVRAKSGNIVPAGDSRNVVVDLPPGFVGNPLITPRCPQSQLANPGFLGSPACNDEMAVGALSPILSVFGAGPAFGTPIYNDIPAYGQAAEFTTKIGEPEQSLLGSVRATEDFGVTIEAPNNPNLNKIFGTYAALQGEPAGAHGKAFLDNPTACAQQREESSQGRGPWTAIEASSWQAPTAFGGSIDPLPLITNCKPLTESWLGNGPDPANEKPSFNFQPSTTNGSSPTGAIARLHIPQAGLTDPSKLVTAHLKKAVVTLPQGVTVNPSSANGLEACSEEQIGLRGTNFESPAPIRFNADPPSCPNGSKLGSFKASTPLLEEEIGGTIYLAEQEKNPFNSLIALYLVVESERFGLLLKLAGEVKPDSGKEGQLTATFDNNPQAPIENLVLNFRGGERDGRSELATPEVCGHYATTGSFTPWSAEAGEAAQTAESGFTVNSNCASSPEKRPFSPAFDAGTVDPKAGTYSPLVVRINRKDGEQELDQLDFTLPMGLVGKLAGIPYCSNSAIAAAASKKGKDELANPSCPSASQVGTVDSAAGVGSEPVHVGGRVYLAGPYKGAPISTVVITPAVAGPFDLGTVVIRAPAFIDLETAQITVKSDPVPTMLKGLPLKLRSVVINVDRSGFILNPTNCEPQRFAARIHSSNGGSATPSSRFQVGGCNKLKFKPKLKLSLKGATRRSGHPALKAVVTYPKQGAYSNIARAQVGLPHSEFLDQGNLDKVCTQPELKSATCPKRAIYGRAKAWTPLLDKPLEGPVYIGVGYGHKLPDLVADLNGQVRILLHGKVDTTKQEGLRNTFEVVPDAPVSRFVLEMKGGKKYGLLENSENICSKPQRASVLFKAQNGLTEHLTPKIANDCGKKKPKGKQKN